MRGYDFKLPKRMKGLLAKPIKGKGMSSLNHDFGFGFTCTKKDSQPIERLSCILEEMDLSKFLRKLMTMLIKWTFQVSFQIDYGFKGFHSAGSYHLVSEQGFQSGLILSCLACLFDSRASLF